MVEQPHIGLWFISAATGNSIITTEGWNYTFRYLTPPSWEDLFAGLIVLMPNPSFDAAFVVGDRSELLWLWGNGSGTGMAFSRAVHKDIFRSTSLSLPDPRPWETMGQIPLLLQIKTFIYVRVLAMLEFSQMPATDSQIPHTLARAYIAVDLMRH